MRETFLIKGAPMNKYHITKTHNCKTGQHGGLLLNIKIKANNNNEIKNLLQKFIKDIPLCGHGIIFEKECGLYYSLGENHEPPKSNN